MLQLRQVQKSFGYVVALDAINLTLSPGITAVMGANGSGKSTLLRLLATSIEPDDGTIHLNDYAYTDYRQALRQSIGFLPQELDFPSGMTVERLLRYFARLHQVDYEQVVPGLLDTLHIADLHNKPLKHLSTGQCRLVGLAQACLKNAHLLLLDELTASLDVETSRRVYRFIRSRLQPGQYVIFSTHIADDVTRLADALVIIREGHVMFDGTPSELIQQAAGHVYQAHIPRDELPQWTQRYTVTQTHETDDNRLLIRIVSTTPVQNASPVSPALEDAYLYMTL